MISEKPTKTWLKASETLLGVFWFGMPLAALILLSSPFVVLGISMVFGISIDLERYQSIGTAVFSMSSLAFSASYGIRGVREIIGWTTRVRGGGKWKMGFFIDSLTNFALVGLMGALGIVSGIVALQSLWGR